MTGKMNWARANKLYRRQTLDHRTEAEAIERTDRRLRGHRRRRPAVQSPPSFISRTRSICPDGSGCTVEIIELPQAARYRRAFAVLQVRCPDHAPPGRWQLAVEDGKRFLVRWGLLAEAMGWTSADLCPPVARMKKGPPLRAAR
jgi:hypothetical protein